MNVYPERISFKKFIYADLVEPLNNIFKKDRLTDSEKLFKDISRLREADLYYYMFFYHDDVFIGGSVIEFNDDVIVFDFEHLDINKEVEKKVIKKCIDTIITDLKNFFPEDKIQFKTE